MPARRCSPDKLALFLQPALESGDGALKIRMVKIGPEGRRLVLRLVDLMAGHLKVRPAPTTEAEVSDLHALIRSSIMRFARDTTSGGGTHSDVTKKVKPPRLASSGGTSGLSQPV